MWGLKRDTFRAPTHFPHCLPLPAHVVIVVVVVDGVVGVGVVVVVVGVVVVVVVVLSRIPVVLARFHCPCRIFQH